MGLSGDFFHYESSSNPNIAATCSRADLLRQLVPPGNPRADPLVVPDVETLIVEPLNLGICETLVRVCIADEDMVRYPDMPGMAFPTDSLPVRQIESTSYA